MWHFVMGYNIVTNNGDYLQSLYKWSTNDGVYVDHISSMWNVMILC